MNKKNTQNEPHTIKADKFRQMLNVSPNTFKKLLEEGRIPQPLPLGSKVRRWSVVVVHEFLQQI